MTTDTERLDWLDSQRTWGDGFTAMELDSGDVFVRPWRYANQMGDFRAKLVAQDIRTVIDAAMRGEPVGLMPQHPTVGEKHGD